MGPLNQLLTLEQWDIPVGQAGKACDIPIGRAGKACDIPIGPAGKACVTLVIPHFLVYFVSLYC